MNKKRIPYRPKKPSPSAVKRINKILNIKRYRGESSRVICQLPLDALLTAVKEGFANPNSGHNSSPTIARFITFALNSTDYCTCTFSGRINYCETYFDVDIDSITITTLLPVDYRTIKFRRFAFNADITDELLPDRCRAITAWWD